MRFINLNKIDRREFNAETETDVEVTKPVVVNVEAIRCFYPRRGGVAGTRITFTDGGGFAVAEAPDVVADMIGNINRPNGPLQIAPPEPAATADSTVN